VKPSAEQTNSVPARRGGRGLLRGVLFVQSSAHGQSGVGIDRAVAFVDQLDDALLVDDNVGAQGPLVRFVVFVVAFEDAVGLEHLAVHVAEEREGDADLLGECGVGSGAIHTDTEDFRIRGVDFSGGDSSLDRLKLLRSTAGEGQDVDGEVNILLAAVVAELHGFPPVAKKGEIRSSVSDLEGHLGDLRLFGLGHHRGCGKSGSDQEAESDLVFHRNLLCELRRERQRKLTPRLSSNTTGMAKIFPNIRGMGI